MKLITQILVFACALALTACASDIHWSPLPVVNDQEKVRGPRSATEDLLDRDNRTDCTTNVFSTATNPPCH